MKKKKFLTYLIVALAVTVTLVFCFSMITNINRRMNESATSNLLYTTQVIEGNLENNIGKDFDSLNVIGELYKRRRGLEAEMLDTLCKTMGFEWIGIAGRPDLAKGSLRDTFSLTEAEWYEQWKPEERGYSDAYIGASGRLQATFWVPVYEAGEWVGTVFGDVLLTKYYTANVFTFHGRKGRTYLFDGSDGRWILKSLGTDGLSESKEDIYALLAESGNQTEEVQAFRQAVEAGKTGTVVFDFNGESSYLCFMPLSSSSDWYVVTVIARSVLLKESSGVQRMIQLLLLFFCCAVVIFSIAFINWQNRKIRLKEASSREALFTNVFSSVDSVFLIYDKKKKRTVFVSQNVKRILGLEAKELKADAAKLFDWCRMEHSDPLRIRFLDGSLNKTEVFEVCVENEVGLKSRFIRVELIPAGMDQEIMMLTDITGDKDIQNSLREAMERAESASRAKNDFLSAMSHDIRTPMNGIVGMTAIANAHMDDKERVRDCLSKISEASGHLLSLINEILDMSKIESGKMEFSEESFNLGNLIQEALNVNLPGIRQKNHSIHVHISSMDHEQVIGDPARMQRIVTNLLSNAIKYTPDGGTISVVLTEKPPEVKGYGCYELIVQDDGIGMSPEFQEKIFQPFEREADVRLGKIQGTGLGMAIVKNIVDQMMGQIEVKSSKGQGSTFRVKVNLKLDALECDSCERLIGLPVLVAAPGRTACQTLTGMLKDIGMTGEWADSDSLAAEMVSERHRKGKDYLAVLLDGEMQEMDGLLAARRIRAGEGGSIPSIILMAYDWSAIETEALCAGVDLFMAKPVYKSKLLERMLSLTGEPEDKPVYAASADGNGIMSGRRVLVAEDNALNLEIAVELLHMLRLEAETAVDGEEAVERFLQSEVGYYDLILMDIQMPGKNGYEAARAIRAMDREDAGIIPIVAMTADAFTEDIQAANAAGMNEHISKPVSVERLIQVLGRFLPDGQAGEGGGSV